MNKATTLLILMFVPFALFASMATDTSTHQFIVNLDHDTSQDTILAYLEELNAEEIWEIDELDIALWEVRSFPVTLNSGEEIYDINNLLRRIRRKTKIKNLDFNLEASIPELDENDGSTGCFDITAYQIPLGSNDVKISILDTGISDISDNSTADYNYNLSSYTGYDYIDQDDTPNDLNGHGTHVAGLIHAITQHNPNNKISFDIRKTHDANGRAMVSDLVLAMYEAMEDGANIINLSFSATNDFDPEGFYPLRRVIEEAEDEGVLVIAAAGNEGADNDILSNTALPASFPDANVVSVTSDNGNGLASFANYGATTVDVAVCGVNVPGPDLNDGITYMTGTSQSTAIVSAVAAMLATTWEDEYMDTKCNLVDGSTPIYALNGAVDGCADPRSVEESIARNNLQVYPNVVRQGEVHIEAEDITSITITKDNGQPISPKLIQESNNRAIICTDDWNAGIYFVTNNRGFAQKIVVLK